MDSSKKSWMSRVGIVVIAAILVEIVSVVHYEHLRSMIMEDMDIRGRIVLGSMASEIGNVLELTETTMKENLWDIRRSIARPDSVSAALVRLIDDNPHVDGGCLAFVPYYYPSKGRIFEPYAQKSDGAIVLSQIADEKHDYTQNKAFRQVLQTQCPVWSDPYYYGPDSLGFTTYSYPIRDREGRLAAVCGLDMDLSWLGDTLNARQPYRTSFALLLTEEGELVAAPSEDRIPEADVLKVVDVVNGVLPESSLPDLYIRTTKLKKDPYWVLVQVHRKDEVLARMRRMRLNQMLFILLGLSILAFMINRYARNEKKLRVASEEQARINGELAAARSIQQQMVPETFPPFVYGSLEPAKEVGGDIYDFFIRDGKLFFCIGDVTGKGVPSAILMSVAHSLFRMVARKEESPSLILEALNHEICSGNESNMFLTFFVGCLDLYSGVLTFGNAGHDKPFLISDGFSLLQTKANLPLGVFPDTRFEEQSCVLSPGAILLLYTDGLTEAKNPGRQQFGRDGVAKVLEGFLAGGGDSLETLVTSLSEAAHNFAGEAPQSDDLTLLAVRYSPENQLHGELVLDNDTAALPRFTAFVTDFCSKLDLDRKKASGLRLALEEVVVNVIDYAYPEGEKGSICIHADSNREEVRFTVVDSGIPFDPTSVLEADTTLDAQMRPIGGLGILLARKLTDSVTYCRRNGQNVLTLTKSIV